MSGDLKAKLTQLKELHEMGLLTDDDFQKQKDALLATAMGTAADAMTAMATRNEVIEAQELSTKMQSALNVQEMLRACETKVRARSRTSNNNHS